MALVKISRGTDIQHKYTDGVSRVSVLEGAYKDATVERVSLQPGADFTPETYTPVSYTHLARHGYTSPHRAARARSSG